MYPIHLGHAAANMGASDAMISPRYLEAQDAPPSLQEHAEGCAGYCDTHPDYHHQSCTTQVHYARSVGSWPRHHHIPVPASQGILQWPICAHRATVGGTDCRAFEAGVFGVFTFPLTLHMAYYQVTHSGECPLQSLFDLLRYFQICSEGNLGYDMGSPALITVIRWR